MKQLVVWLPKDIAEQFTAKVAANGDTKAAIVKQAIINYLETKK